MLQLPAMYSTKIILAILGLLVAASPIRIDLPPQREIKEVVEMKKVFNGAEFEIDSDSIRIVGSEKTIMSWEEESMENGSAPKTEEQIVLGSIFGIWEGSDFDLGFDVMLEFISKNPESETAKSFLDYHIREMDSPLCSDGKTPCFTYLIGKKFIPEEWIAPEDMEGFWKVAAESDYKPE